MRIFIEEYTLLNGWRIIAVNGNWRINRSGRQDDWMDISLEDIDEINKEIGVAGGGGFMREVPSLELDYFRPYPPEDFTVEALEQAETIIRESGKGGI